RPGQRRDRGTQWGRYRRAAGPPHAGGAGDRGGGSPQPGGAPPTAGPPPPTPPGGGGRQVRAPPSPPPPPLTAPPPPPPHFCPTSATAARTRVARSAASTSLPATWSYSRGIRSSGLGRLPVCVVRIRSVLHFIAFLRMPIRTIAMGMHSGHNEHRIIRDRCA